MCVIVCVCVRRVGRLFSEIRDQNNKGFHRSQIAHRFDVVLRVKLKKTVQTLSLKIRPGSQSHSSAGVDSWTD